MTSLTYADMDMQTKNLAMDHIYTLTYTYSTNKPRHAEGVIAVLANYLPVGRNSNFSWFSFAVTECSPDSGQCVTHHRYFVR